MPPAPLIWFADDWGRHPSSSQHLARQLLARRPICWVNTIGTRKPGFNLDTLKRGFEKLRHWSKPRAAAELPANLRVNNPRMWPWFSHRWDRRLNRALLSRHLRKLMAELPSPPSIVTTLPLTADLIGCEPAARWIYYCVDDFSVWPGLDGRTMLAMERRLVARADRIVAVSETLRERIKAMGRTAELLTHGVDLEFWSYSPRLAGGNRDQSDRAIPSNEPNSDGYPRQAGGYMKLLFWGVIDRRMDTAVVRALAASGLGTVVLVGPHNDPDPQLLAIPGVKFIPAQPLDALPGLAQQAAVLVMPYANLPVTRAIQPLKLKEYLATGLPCVVRDLPANRDWADCLDLADSPESFVAAVKRRLDEGLPESQRLARRRLEREGWDEKAREFERIIDE